MVRVRIGSYLEDESSGRTNGYGDDQKELQRTPDQPFSVVARAGLKCPTSTPFAPCGFPDSARARGNKFLETNAWGGRKPVEGSLVGNINEQCRNQSRWFCEGILRHLNALPLDEDKNGSVPSLLNGRGEGGGSDESGPNPGTAQSSSEVATTCANHYVKLVDRFDYKVGLVDRKRPWRRHGARENRQSPNWWPAREPLRGLESGAAQTSFSWRDQPTNKVGAEVHGRGVPSNKRQQQPRFRACPSSHDKQRPRADTELDRGRGRLVHGSYLEVSANQWAARDERGQNECNRVKCLPSSTEAAAEAAGPRREFARLGDERFCVRRGRFPYSGASPDQTDSVRERRRRKSWQKRQMPSSPPPRPLALRQTSAKLVGVADEAASDDIRSSRQSESKRRRKLADTKRRRPQQGHVASARRHQDRPIAVAAVRIDRVETSFMDGGENPIERRHCLANTDKCLTQVVADEVNKCAELNDCCISRTFKPIARAPPDCFIPEARRQPGELRTQRLRRTTNNNEGGCGLAVVASTVAGPNSQQRRIAVVANHHLHEHHDGDSPQGCQQTATTKTRPIVVTAAYQSTLAKGLPKRDTDGNQPAVDSTSLNVSLQSLSSFPSKRALSVTTPTGAAISTKRPACKRLSCKTTSTIAANTNRHNQLLQSEEEQQQQETPKIGAVRLPFEVAPSQQQQLLTQIDCAHMIRGGGEPSSRKPRQAPSGREIVSDTSKSRQPERNVSSLIVRKAKDSNDMDLVQGEKRATKSSKTTAPSRQQSDRSNRSNINTNKQSPAAANRVALLETPPSSQLAPRTATTRQNRLPFSSERRSSANSLSRAQAGGETGNKHRQATGVPDQSQPSPVNTGKKSRNSAASAARSSSSSRLSGRPPAQASPVALSSTSLSNDQEWSPQTPVTNVHSLEVIGQEARMAISIYDPLPAQQRQQEQTEDSLQDRKPPLLPHQQRSPSVVRPSELSLIEETRADESPARLLDQPRARRARGRHRGRSSSERLLKSPTIPEEENESELPVSGPVGQRAVGSTECFNKVVEATCGAGNANLTSESFMVATIADETGDHSRTLIIYSDRSLADLKHDILEKLLEIELERQQGQINGSTGELPTTTSVARRQRSRSADSNGEEQRDSSCEPDETDKAMQELNIEAEKLARLFKSHLEGARTPTSFCSSTKPRFDPTSLGPDERARFVGRANREGRKGAEPIGGGRNRQANNDAASERRPSGETVSRRSSQNSHRDVYDFRCACCCLHLVNQQRPDGTAGEHWCCCAGN